MKIVVQTIGLDGKVVKEDTFLDEMEAATAMLRMANRMMQDNNLCPTDELPFTFSMVRRHSLH